MLRSFVLIIPARVHVYFLMSTSSPHLSNWTPIICDYVIVLQIDTCRHNRAYPPEDMHCTVKWLYTSTMFPYEPAFELPREKAIAISGNVTRAARLSDIANAHKQLLRRTTRSSTHQICRSNKSDLYLA